MTADTERELSELVSAPPSRPGRAAVDFYAVVLLESVLVVLILWYRGGGLAALFVPGAALGSIAQVLGLLAANLLLVQVLLMARIPWLERYLGQDELVRLHRYAGSLAVGLLLAHIATIALSRARPAGRSVLAQFVTLVTSTRPLTMAMIGALVVLVVAAVSVRIARRHLPYHRWHLLHLNAYLGIGFAVPHQLLIGTSFVTAPGARLYWWTLYLVTLCAVLVFRVGAPLLRNRRHRLVVDEVVEEAPGVTSVYIKGRRLDRLGARAGQFFFWRFTGERGGLRANPFSLSAGPRTDCLRITVREAGDGSGRVQTLTPGTRVLVEGPFGAVTGARRTGRPVLLAAAGVGITPMRALLDELDASLPGTTLLYRVRDLETAVFAAELQAFEERGLRLHYLTGRRDEGGWLPPELCGRGEVEALDVLVPGVEDHDVYLCGPLAWMRLVRATLIRAGVPRERIFAEEFGW
jgi:predicted ferric reductase